MRRWVPRRHDKHIRGREDGASVHQVDDDGVDQTHLHGRKNNMNSSTHGAPIAASAGASRPPRHATRLYHKYISITNWDSRYCYPTHTIR